MTLALTLKTAWSEHGTWAILLSAFALGTLVALPPTLATLSTLAGLAGFAVAKAAAARVWRTRQGWLSLLLWGIPSAAAMIPILCEAPTFVLSVAAVGFPFMALFVWEAREPKWIRTLPVEFAGTVLLSSAAGLALLASHPKAWMDALLATGAAAALFLPGMPRARMLKDRGWGLRVSLLFFALVGAAAVGVYAWLGVIAPWGSLAALIFVGDLRAFWVVPSVTARHLGLALTLRSGSAVLLLASSWRPL